MFDSQYRESTILNPIFKRNILKNFSSFIRSVKRHYMMGRFFYGYLFVKHLQKKLIGNRDAYKMEIIYKLPHQNFSINT